MSNHDYKNNNGRNFQFTIFSFIDFVLMDREVFQVNGQNRPVANLPVVDFQAREMLTPRPLNTKLSVFLSGKFKPHCLSAIRFF